MKLVVLSYSHHGRSIGRTGRDLGHEIVGVMDGEEGVRTQLESEITLTMATWNTAQSDLLEAKRQHNEAVGQLEMALGVRGWEGGDCDSHLDLKYVE